MIRMMAVVAAMKVHPDEVDVQRDGCGTLRIIALGDAACKQAVVEAGIQLSLNPSPNLVLL